MTGRAALALAIFGGLLFVALVVIGMHAVLDPTSTVIGAVQ